MQKNIKIIKKRERRKGAQVPLDHQALTKKRKEMNVDNYKFKIFIFWVSLNLKKHLPLTAINVTDIPDP